MGDGVGSGSLPSCLFASKSFAFDDRVSSSVLRQQLLVISVRGWYTSPHLFLTNVCDNCLLIGDLN